METVAAQNENATHHLGFAIKELTCRGIQSPIIRVFEKLFHVLLPKLKNNGKRDFKFKNPLYSYM